MSPSSVKDFTERMYNNADLASQYEWNANRRGGSPSVRPNVNVHSRKYLCLQTSETFQYKDCYGRPHIDLKSKDTTDFFEYFIANWIDVSKI